MKIPFEKVEVTLPGGKVVDFRPGEGQLQHYVGSQTAGDVEYYSFTGTVKEDNDGK